MHETLKKNCKTITRLSKRTTDYARVSKIISCWCFRISKRAEVPNSKVNIVTNWTHLYIFQLSRRFLFYVRVSKYSNGKNTVVRTPWPTKPTLIKRKTQSELKWAVKPKYISDHYWPLATFAKIWKSLFQPCIQSCFISSPNKSAGRKTKHTWRQKGARPSRKKLHKHFFSQITLSQIRWN